MSVSAENLSLEDFLDEVGKGGGESAAPPAADAKNLSVLMSSLALGKNDQEYFGAEDIADLRGIVDEYEGEDEDTISEASEVSSQFGEAMAYVSIFDTLTRSPDERRVEDVETVLEYTQHLPAFANLTLSVKRKLCWVMELQTFRDVQSPVIRSGEEVDSWWVVFGGSVEVNKDGDTQRLHLGECFGAARGSQKKKILQIGTITTCHPDTILLRVPAAKYYEILSKSEQSSVKVEEDGKVVLVKEFSEETCTHVAVRATPDLLLCRLLEEEEHPLYAEDFLLGHRTFIPGETVAEHLCKWFMEVPECRDRVARIFLLWVNNHIDDFDGKDGMLALIEKFRNQLQDVGMKGQFQLLNMACQVRPALLGTNSTVTPTISPMSMRHSISEIDVMSVSPPQERASGHRQSLRLMKLPFGKNRKVDRGQMKKRSPSPLVRTNSNTSIEEGTRSSCPSISVSGPGTGAGLGTSQMLPSEAGVTLKVFKPDHSYRFVTVVSETTAEQLIRAALKQFDIHEETSNYSLCRISVSPEGLVKQTRLPDAFHSLPSHLTLTSRYYIKNNVTTNSLVHGDELLMEVLAEGATDFLSLDPRDIARAVTLQDFAVYRQITPVEYFEDLWGLEKSSPNDGLMRFSETTNHEMFWVVNEVLNEPNPAQRVRVIKHFLKIAKLCRKVFNFNTMFAIISGLSYGAVGKLRTTWAKVGQRHLKTVAELQELMNPSRNMFNYRRLLKGAKPPIIPFFPVVKKDITFLYLGNDNKIDGLINFEKLRMVSHDIRAFAEFHSANYNHDTLLSLTSQQNRGKAAFYDQWMIERRVSHYLANLEVNTNEAELKERAMELEEQHLQIVAGKAQAPPPTTSLRRPSVFTRPE
ncbi:rap guanine nucleotide exchange factor 2-like [Sycon ciliatum]|uniref:rap guanine nucleotide exchange factor 2-like n=1 Tax=Sycon ciliatum TaxID=27933 RepID=UPI0031F61DB2